MTMIEVLAVLMILAIMGAIGLWAITGTRDNGGRVELRSAAKLYADAVERYQTDHGRNTPVLGSQDWPDARKGPLHRLSIGGATTVRPYLTSPVPEVLQRTTPNGAKFASSAPADGGALIYRRSGALSFYIEAWWDGKRLCAAGDVPAQMQSC